MADAGINPSQQGTFYSLTTWNRVMTADPGELDLELGPGAVEGEVPSWMVGGTFASNGPARVLKGGRLAHPFDGHGLIRSIQFQGRTSARLRTRFVRTEAFTREGAADHLVYVGLGTLVAPPTLSGGGFLRNMFAPGRKNVANTSLYLWNGRLLAGWEGGLPHHLDPVTLETRGVDNFGGALGDVAFLAHVRVDQARGRLVGLDQALGRETTLTFHEFDGQGRRVAQRVFKQPGSMFIHDFAITPHYYVITGNPLGVKVGAFLKARLGLGTLMEAIYAEDTRPGQVILIPREGDSTPVTVDLNRPLFGVHHANAFETPEGRVVLDTCAFETISFGQEFGYQGGHLPLDPTRLEYTPHQIPLRISVDPVSRQAEVVNMDNRCVDFPRIHPLRDGLRCDTLVGAARAEASRKDPFNAVIRWYGDNPGKVDLWAPGGGQFVGEPVLVTPPGAQEEGEGVVLVLVYNAEKEYTDLCMLDVNQVQAGPFAVIHLPPLLPYGFHGTYYHLP